VCRPKAVSSQGPTHSLASMAPDLSVCYEFATRYFQDDRAHAAKNLGAKTRHPITQPLECFRRRDLAGGPPAHLATGVERRSGLTWTCPLGASHSSGPPPYWTHANNSAAVKPNGTAAKKLNAGDFFSQ